MFEFKPYEQALIQLHQKIQNAFQLHAAKIAGSQLMNYFVSMPVFIENPSLTQAIKAFYLKAETHSPKDFGFTEENYPLRGLCYKAKRLYFASILRQEAEQLSVRLEKDSLSILSPEYEDTLVKLTGFYKDYRLDEYQRSFNYEAFFGLSVFQQKYKKLLNFLKTLKSFFKEFEPFHDLAKIQAEESLLNKDKGELLLTKIRQSDLSSAIKINLREKLDNLFNKHQGLQQAKGQEIKDKIEHIQQKVKRLQEQLQAFALMLEADNIDYRTAVFTREACHELSQKKTILLSLMMAWPSAKKDVPDVQFWIERYDTQVELLLKKLNAQVKAKLIAVPFELQRCTELLMCYQAYLKLKKTTEEDRENLTHIRRKLFWTVYERQYRRARFFSCPRSFWLYRRKKDISWSEIFRHANGETPGYSGSRTKKTLMLLGWIDGDLKISKQARWLRGGKALQPISLNEIPLQIRRIYPS